MGASTTLEFLASVQKYLPVFKDLATIVPLIPGFALAVRYWKKTQERKPYVLKYAKSYTVGEVRRARIGYIEPFGSTQDPSTPLEYDRHVRSKEPILTMIRDRTDGSRRRFHAFILADSGMGKTTLLINIFGHELYKITRKRVPFVLISLASDNVIEKISAIEDPQERFLLLDALDEDPFAQAGSIEQRIRQIMRAAEDFAGVIITCRTQFFSNDDALPQSTGIKIYTQREAGCGSTYEFTLIYLMPFTMDQIRRYFRSKIPFYQRDRRRKALEIVESIDDLARRPMLLEAIPGLTHRSEHPVTTYELYSHLIQIWIKREKDWIAGDTLVSASRVLARAVIDNERKFGLAIIDSKVASGLLAEAGIVIEQWKLRSRSLLNRTASGDFKFSHRSIMEYMLVLDARESSQLFPDHWSDVMSELYCNSLRISMDSGKEFILKDVLNETPSKADKMLSIIRKNTSKGRERNEYINISGIHRKIKNKDFGDGDEKSIFSISWLPKQVIRETIQVAESQEAIVVFPAIGDSIFTIPGLSNNLKQEPLRILRVDPGYSRELPRRLVESCGGVISANEFIRFIYIIIKSFGVPKYIPMDTPYWVSDIYKRNDRYPMNVAISISASQNVKSSLDKVWHSEHIDSIEFVVGGFRGWIHIVGAPGDGQIRMAHVIHCSYGNDMGRFVAIKENKNWDTVYINSVRGRRALLEKRWSAAAEAIARDNKKEDDRSNKGGYDWSYG